MDKEVSVPESSPTICAYPWVHLRLMRNQSFLPCCNFVGREKPLSQTVSLKKALNEELLSDMRDKMLAGERINGCNRCYEKEASSKGYSMRTQANRDFPEAWEHKPSLRYVEFYFGNLCNLKCRGCCSEASTKWIRDEIKIGRPQHEIWKSHKNPLSLLDDSWESLTHIKLLGGEPLLFPEHEDFIRNLRTKSNLEQVYLEYSTNGTLRASPLVIDTWHQVRHLVFSFSIDGIRERNDFLREGSQWEEILKNIRWYQQQLRHAKVTFKIHSVVNIYNVSEIVEMDDWLESEFPHFQRSKDCLYNPDALDCRSLPRQEKERLAAHYDENAKKYESHLRRKISYNYIRDFLRQPIDKDFGAFVELDHKLNEIRNRHLQDFYPQLAKLADAYCNENWEVEGAKNLEV